MSGYPKAKRPRSPSAGESHIELNDKNDSVAVASSIADRQNSRQSLLEADFGGSISKRTRLSTSPFQGTIRNDKGLLDPHTNHDISESHIDHCKTARNVQAPRVIVRPRSNRNYNPLVSEDMSLSLIVFDEAENRDTTPWDLSGNTPLQPCWGIYGTRPYHLSAPSTPQPISSISMTEESWNRLRVNIQNIIEGLNADLKAENKFWKHVNLWCYWCEYRNKSVIVNDDLVAEFLTEYILNPFIKGAVQNKDSGKNKGFSPLIFPDILKTMDIIVMSLAELRKIQDLFLPSDLEIDQASGNSVSSLYCYIKTLADTEKGTKRLTDRNRECIEVFYGCADQLFWPLRHRIWLNCFWLCNGASIATSQDRCAHLLSLYGLLPQKKLPTLRAFDLGITELFRDHYDIDIYFYALSIFGKNGMPHKASHDHERSRPQRVARHKDVTFCAVGALATYIVELYSQYESQGKLPFVLDFESWSNLMLFPPGIGRKQDKPNEHKQSILDHGSAEYRIDYKHSGVYVPSTKDWEYRLGEYLAQPCNASYSEIQKSSANKPQSLSDEDIVRLANFPQFGSYKLARAIHDPPESLSRKILPWLDAYMVQIRMYNQVTLPNIIARSKGGHFSSDLPPSIHVELHLQLLKWLRTVFLQDWALLQKLFSKHPILEHSVFQDQDWKLYSHLVLSSALNNHLKEFGWYEDIVYNTLPSTVRPLHLSNSSNTQHGRLESLEELKASIAASKSSTNRNSVHSLLNATNVDHSFRQNRQPYAYGLSSTPSGHQRGVDLNNMPTLSPEISSGVGKGHVPHTQKSSNGKLYQHRVVVKPLNRSPIGPSTATGQSGPPPGTPNEKLHVSGSVQANLSPSLGAHLGKFRLDQPSQHHRALEPAQTAPIGKSYDILDDYPTRADQQSAMSQPRNQIARRKSIDSSLPSIMELDRWGADYSARHPQKGHSATPSDATSVSLASSLENESQFASSAPAGQSDIHGMSTPLPKAHNPETPNYQKSYHSFTPNIPRVPADNDNGFRHSAPYSAPHSQNAGSSRFPQHYTGNDVASPGTPINRPSSNTSQDGRPDKTFRLSNGDILVHPHIKQLSDIGSLEEMWNCYCDVWTFIEKHRNNNLGGHPLNKIEKKRMWEWRRMIEEVIYTLAHRRGLPMPHTQRQQLWTPELYSRFQEIKEMCVILDAERMALDPGNRRWGSFKKHLIKLRQTSYKGNASGDVPNASRQ